MSDDIFQTVSLKAKARELPIGELIAAAAAIAATGQVGQARELYDIWIKANGDDPKMQVVLFNNSALAVEQGDDVSAERDLREALARDPNFLPAYINLGSVLERAGSIDGAIAQWREAAGRSVPVNGNAVLYVTTALKQITRVLSGHHQGESAELAARLCLEIDPNQRDAIEQLIALRLSHCMWPVSQPLERLSRNAIVRGIHPLSMAAYTDDPLFQLGVADNYSKTQPHARPKNFSSDRRHAPIDLANRRLRVGYISSDLRDHAIGYLMVELFEVHDRARVEVFAYYCGPDSNSELHHRTSRAVEHWSPINKMTDDEAAAKIMADGIDILVDVNGHTRDARSGVFARRPAPIQVNWLGFPGTMGTPYHHYIIADEAIIPEGAELYYSEKVLRLLCYQPNDRKRKIAEKTPTRAEVGLPDEAFVYCCFNGTHKITRFTFTRWLEILKRVPHGVLWLLDTAEETKKRLRDFAEKNSVSSDRFVFAPKMANPEHLARYRLADVFLDTTPYGAHTTASDALWMGIPVLTVPGLCFASRVCGSLVSAAGLPDLVCTSMSDYVERAVALASNPGHLAVLKRRLALSRETCNLFNTDLLARNLENLFFQMAGDYAQGVLPQPNLANLDEYFEAGVSLDHEAEEIGQAANYHGLYKDKLAHAHRCRPLAADQRLWTEADIAAADQWPAASAVQPSPANDVEPGIDERFAHIFSNPSDNSLLQLRDIHDVASAILCNRLDLKSAQQLSDLLASAACLEVAAEPGSEWESWEKHYRLLTGGIALNMVLDPTPESAPLSEAKFVSATGTPMSRDEVKRHAARLGAKAVFFSAADESYVHQYARWHMLSVLKYCDVPFLIVCHVIGGAGRLSAIARSVGLDDEHIIFAGDHFDAAAVTTLCFDAPPKGKSERPIAHFQSIRFLRAGNLLESLKLPMFVSDIDLLLQRGVADLLGQHADMDLVLNENLVSKAAGSRLTANLLLLNPTPRSAVFLRFLRAYLERALAGPEVTRWIDQLGLILAWHHLTIQYPDARIGHFDTDSDINNVIYPSYQVHPFRFLSLYHGFDTSSLENNPHVLGGDVPSRAAAIAAQ
jgi:predicted O-linked N-acetylglucosamine transferase (SPINDLY family)